MLNIYVLSADGKPLMPIHSHGRARRLLSSGKATIVSYMPFTIKLTYEIKNPGVDGCLLGIDPGRTNIGLCAVDGSGRWRHATRWWQNSWPKGRPTARHQGEAKGSADRGVPYHPTRLAWQDTLSSGACFRDATNP